MVNHKSDAPRGCVRGVRPGRHATFTPRRRSACEKTDRTPPRATRNLRSPARRRCGGFDLPITLADHRCRSPCGALFAATSNRKPHRHQTGAGAGQSGEGRFCQQPNLAGAWNRNIPSSIGCRREEKNPKCPSPDRPSAPVPTFVSRLQSAPYERRNRDTDPNPTPSLHDEHTRRASCDSAHFSLFPGPTFRLVSRISSPWDWLVGFASGLGFESGTADGDACLLRTL